MPCDLITAKHLGGEFQETSYIQITTKPPIKKIEVRLFDNLLLMDFFNLCTIFFP